MERSPTPDAVTIAPIGIGVPVAGLPLLIPQSTAANADDANIEKPRPNAAAVQSFARFINSSLVTNARRRVMRSPRRRPAAPESWRSRALSRHRLCRVWLPETPQ